MGQGNSPQTEFEYCLQLLILHSLAVLDLVSPALNNHECPIVCLDSLQLQ